MKLVKTLVKVLVVAGIAGGTLGGAAALGSTLWDRPPRDAAEFAERVEAGSTHWEDVAKTGLRGAIAGQNSKAKQQNRKAKPGPRVTTAELRYSRALNRMCVQAEDEFRALGQPRSLTEVTGYMERALVLAKRYDARFAALRPPPRFRDEAAQMRDLNARGERLLQRTVRAARARDSYALLELSDRLISLGSRGNDLYARLGAVRCVTELIPAY